MPFMPWMNPKFRHAYPIGNGMAVVSGDTFHIREKIKGAGGKWNGRVWHMPIAELEACGIPLMVRVRVEATCCTKRMGKETVDDWAHPEEIKQGTVRQSCSYCDCSYRCGIDAKIVEVLPEHEQVRPS